MTDLTPDDDREAAVIHVDIFTGDKEAQTTLVNAVAEVVYDMPHDAAISMHTDGPCETSLHCGGRLLARAEKAERERNEAREALARVEALVDRAEARRDHQYYLVTAGALRAALRGGDA